MDTGKLLFSLALAMGVTLGIGVIILIAVALIWSIMYLPHWATAIFGALLMIVGLTIYFYLS